MNRQSWIEAHAKINLALHITGQRGDGYHLLETIAVFADLGDRVGIANAGSDEFMITGPHAAELSGDDPARNLVVRAREMLRDIARSNGREAPPVSLTLEKNLPAGSGIGGGSADAAAALRGLAEHWQARDLMKPAARKAVALGADVPMCLHSIPVFARGVGETLRPMANVPAMAMVLANPGVHISTPTVFAALVGKDNPPLPLAGTSGLADPISWAAWLGRSTRNDLQAPSIGLAPVIAACITALEKTDALLVRMSGSGATCFGIFGDDATARAATEKLLRDHPDWWIKKATTGASEQQPGFQEA